jgi:hypothetical protein
VQNELELNLACNIAVQLETWVNASALSSAEGQTRRTRNWCACKVGKKDRVRRPD